MSAAKHTQGPWSIQHDTDIVGTENDPANGCVGLVDVAHVYLRTVPGRTQANARLIAAAPDLLEALRRLTFAALCRDSTMGDPCRLIEVKAELQAASRYADEVIAKATGSAA